MAQYQILGLFADPEQAADAIDRLRQLGVRERNITVKSSMPVPRAILARPQQKHRIPTIALVGSLLGIMTALVLTVLLYILYPLNQGGQPLVFPVPPSLVIIFEVTMLLTMLLTFFGFWFFNRFPNFKPGAYDPLITAGYLGVVAQVDDRLVDQVEEAYKKTGSEKTTREELDRSPDRRFFIFWGVVIGVVAIGGLIQTLIWYDVIKIYFPSQMVEQESVAYEQGPRLAVPADSVPIQGPVLINGQPASQPIASSPASVQRGAVLYDIHCKLCHGATGVGNGPLAAFFNPKPFDLTSSNVQNLPDSEIFLVITQGRGQMPSLAENLLISERWDVINYVRTLKK